MAHDDVPGKLPPVRQGPGAGAAVLPGVRRPRRPAVSAAALLYRLRHGAPRGYALLPGVRYAGGDLIREPRATRGPFRADWVSLVWRPPALRCAVLPYVRCTRRR